MFLLNGTVTTTYRTILIYNIEVLRLRNKIKRDTILKINRFKIFKKTTKFKRYNRGLTRFIINRKKYILRKKRTSFQITFNLVFHWTQIYSLSRGYSRFTQSLNVLKYSLTLSNKFFAKKVASKHLVKDTKSEHELFFHFTTIKKALYWNRSLYIVGGFKNQNSIFKHTHIGFVNINTSNLVSTHKIFMFGLLTNFKAHTPKDTTYLTPMSFNSKRLLNKITFLFISRLLKDLRKIFILLILMACRKYKIF